MKVKIACLATAVCLLSQCGLPINAFEIPFLSDLFDPRTVSLPVDFTDQQNFKYVLPFKRAETLFVNNGTQLENFLSPKWFPRVWDICITLKVEQNEAASLMNVISRNYSDIKQLSIIQNYNIDVKAIPFLKKFSNLRTLALEFPTDNLELLRDSLPKNTKELMLGESNLANQNEVGLDLPNIKKLDVRGDTIAPGFLAHSNFPALKEVFLGNSVLKEGAAREFAKFKSLRKIEMCHTEMSAEDVQFLKEHGIKAFDPNDPDD